MPVDLNHARKIRDCVPFLETYNTVLETVRTMDDIIAEVESLRSRVTLLSAECRAWREHSLYHTVGTLHAVNQAEIAVDAANALEPERSST